MLPIRQHSDTESWLKHDWEPDYNPALNPQVLELDAMPTAPISPLTLEELQRAQEEDKLCQ